MVALPLLRKKGNITEAIGDLKRKSQCSLDNMTEQTLKDESKQHNIIMAAKK